VRLLPRQISKETFDYISDKTVDSLKADIQRLFDKTSGWDFSINLTGEFTSDNKFKMIPKWQLTYIRGAESKIAYLDGQIFQDEHKRTRVKFTVRPNSIYAIFFFAFPLFGVLVLTGDNINGVKERSTLIIGGLFLILVVPTIMVIFGHFAKKGIKERFIKIFNLRPVN